MESKERVDNQPPQPPSEPAADFQALVENLAQPVVILDRAGKVRFMNPRADRLLAQGFKERLEAHLQNVALRPPAGLVRLRVDGAADLILQIRLSDIAWQGQPAMQLSLTDVTAYAVNEERSSQDIGEAQGAQPRLAGVAHEARGAGAGASPRNATPSTPRVRSGSRRRPPGSRKASARRRRSASASKRRSRNSAPNRRRLRAPRPRRSRRTRSSPRPAGRLTS